MDHMLKDIDRENPKYPQKNLFQCHAAQTIPTSVRPGRESKPPRRQVGDKRTNNKSTVLLHPLLNRELTKLKLTEDSSFLNSKGIHCF